MRRRRLLGDPLPAVLLAVARVRSLAVAAAVAAEEGLPAAAHRAWRGNGTRWAAMDGPWRRPGLANLDWQERARVRTYVRSQTRDP